MIRFKHTGDFSTTSKFLKKPINISSLDTYGKKGVDALSKNTPTATGATANSWSYKIQHTNGRATIYWENSNVVNGVVIAIILQYGHAAKNGSWIQGRDYINPAIAPIFDELVNQAWKEVIK